MNRPSNKQAIEPYNSEDNQIVHWNTLKITKRTDNEISPELLCLHNNSADSLCRAVAINCSLSGSPKVPLNWSIFKSLQSCLLFFLLVQISLMTGLCLWKESETEGSNGLLPLYNYADQQPGSLFFFCEWHFLSTWVCILLSSCESALIVHSCFWPKI